MWSHNVALCIETFCHFEHFMGTRLWLQLASSTYSWLFTSTVHPSLQVDCRWPPLILSFKFKSTSRQEPFFNSGTSTSIWVTSSLLYWFSHPETSSSSRGSSFHLLQRKHFYMSSTTFGFIIFFQFSLSPNHIFKDSLQLQREINLSSVQKSMFTFSILTLTFLFYLGHVEASSWNVLTTCQLSWSCSLFWQLD